MSDMMRSLVLFAVIFSLALLVGCEGSSVSNPIEADASIIDVSSETEAGDPLADLIQCKSHSECAPAYCVNGYCNGDPAPKPDVIENEDVASCDTAEETEIQDEVTIPECASNEDCDEMGPCFEGTCHWGSCAYNLAVECGENQECYETATGETGCVYTCTTDEQCEDFHGNNPCSISTCTEQGQCRYDYTDDIACDNGDACTTNDSCQTGVCNAGEQMDCPGNCLDGVCQNLCEIDSDCAPTDDPCVNVTCDFNNKLQVKVCNYGYKGEAKFCDLENGEQGKCYNFQCVEYECSSSDHCDDGDPCTQNLCTAGQCVYAPQPCECQINFDCNDFNPCTDDICLVGNCQNPAIPGAVGNACAAMAVCQEDGLCVPVQCIAHSDCDDGNPCTDDWCSDNSCWYETNEGCCLYDSQCGDGDPCTTDACIDNVCQFTDTCNDCGSDADCDDDNECTIDTCNAGTCVNDDECFYGDSGFTSLMCNSDADCAGTSFGEFCIESELNGEDFNIESLSLCQPCLQDGEDTGCGENSLCSWGASSSQVGLFVSVYWCEEIVCESHLDCDDGDACTVDYCHVTFCVNNEKMNCSYCDTDADCESNSWCRQSDGGVNVQYEVCEADGTCQVDYWFTLDPDLYGCNNPLNCASDADCPMDGVCMISTCYYYSPDDDFAYPECNDDSLCEFGDCNFETGMCEEWECYGVDNGDGTLSVKLCPIGFGCVDNSCTDEIVAFTCSTNTDCGVAGLGNYCLPDMVTGENTCYQCLFDSDTGEGYDHGCTSNQPFCGWVDDEVGYECLECYSSFNCDNGQICDNYNCVTLEEVACVTDADCEETPEGENTFCVANPVTAENECHICKPDSAEADGIDVGCGSYQHTCVWADEVVFDCTSGSECSSDDDCGPWEECNNGSCEGFGPIYCQFECPDNGTDWQTVVIWHGNDETTEVACGSTWTISQSNLCLWGETHPVAKFNLTDGTYEWGSGGEAILTCNYEPELNPDPELGDLGVTVLEFEDLFCGE